MFRPIDKNVDCLDFAILTILFMIGVIERFIADDPEYIPFARLAVMLLPAEYTLEVDELKAFIKLFTLLDPILSRLLAKEESPSYFNPDVL